MPPQEWGIPYGGKLAAHVEFIQGLRELQQFMHTRKVHLSLLQNEAAFCRNRAKLKRITREIDQERQIWPLLEERQRILQQGLRQYEENLHVRLAVQAELGAVLSAIVNHRSPWPALLTPDWPSLDTQIQCIDFLAVHQTGHVPGPDALNHTQGMAQDRIRFASSLRKNAAQEILRKRLHILHAHCQKELAMQEDGTPKAKAWAHADRVGVEIDYFREYAHLPPLLTETNWQSVFTCRVNLSLPALAALWPQDRPMYGIMRAFLPKDSFLSLELALPLANIGHPMLDRSYAEAPAIPMYDEFDGFDGHMASGGSSGAGKAGRTGMPDRDKKFVPASAFPMSPTLAADLPPETLPPPPRHAPSAPSPPLPSDAHAALLKAEALRTSFWKMHQQEIDAWFNLVNKHMFLFMRKQASYQLFQLRSNARSAPQGREPAFIPNSYAFLVFREGPHGGIFMPGIGLRVVAKPDDPYSWAFLIGLLCIAKNATFIHSLIFIPKLPVVQPIAVK